MSGGSDNVSVYVVDDHPRVLANLVELIDRADGLCVVGSTESAPIALREIVMLRPSVAVIDGRIGGEDGLEVCRQLQTAAPDVACVMVTAGVGVHWGARQAAEAGAAAVLLKQIQDFPLIDVINRVVGTHSGGANR